VVAADAVELSCAVRLVATVDCASRRVGVGYFLGVDDVGVQFSYRCEQWRLHGLMMVEEVAELSAEGCRSVARYTLRYIPCGSTLYYTPIGVGISAGQIVAIRTYFGLCAYIF
jgi:hypothetical protein